MADHRKSLSGRRRIGAAVVAAFATVAGGALMPQPVEAASVPTVPPLPQAKVVTPKNADVVGTCKFQVNRYQNNQIYFTMTANARPATIYGYGANRYTEVHCFMFPSTWNTTDPSDAYAHLAPSSNGAYVAPQTLNGAIGYVPSVTICGYAWVILRNGDTSTTPYTCG